MMGVPRTLEIAVALVLIASMKIGSAEQTLYTVDLQLVITTIQRTTKVVQHLQNFETMLHGYFSKDPYLSLIETNVMELQREAEEAKEAAEVLIKDQLSNGIPHLDDKKAWVILNNLESMRIEIDKTHKQYYSIIEKGNVDQMEFSENLGKMTQLVMELNSISQHPTVLYLFKIQFPQFVNGVPPQYTGKVTLGDCMAVLQNLILRLIAIELEPDNVGLRDGLDGWVQDNKHQLQEIGPVAYGAILELSVNATRFTNHFKQQKMDYEERINQLSYECKLVQDQLIKYLEDYTKQEKAKKTKAQLEKIAIFPDMDIDDILHKPKDEL